MFGLLVSTVAGYWGEALVRYGLCKASSRTLPWSHFQLELKGGVTEIVGQSVNSYSCSIRQARILLGMAPVELLRLRQLQKNPRR